MPPPDLAEAAAVAFTEGWLLSGCTEDFTEAELAAAIGSALDCADHPAVLESTLDLGSLTGTWKTVYGRREKLLAKHLRAVLKAWDACMAELDPRVLARRFRAVMDHTAEAVDTDRQWWKDAATTAAIGWLRGLYRTEGYPALVAAIEAAIRDGMAEGEAGALALAASRQGRTGFAIAKAFSAAYARLADDPDVSQRAADTLAAITGWAAADAGRTLAAQAGDGGTEDDMTSALDDLLAGDDVRSAGTGTDWALYAAIGAGALALYLRAGAEVKVDWITAGGNVCPICLANEKGSPYAPADLPPFPGHPRCVIGSTRVAVPSLVVVARDVLDRNALNPAVEAAVRGRDRGPAAAPAVTEAVGDFGRGNIRAVSDRDYVGDVIAIRTSLGHELTATPNHPVATRDGWVPIAELAVGDHILSSTAAEWVPGGIHPDVDDVPPRIKDVAESFTFEFGPMPTASEDFHGDGASSEIHVVRADRLLVGGTHADVTEHACEHPFGRRDVAMAGPSLFQRSGMGQQSLSPGRLAALGVMGGAGEPGTLLRRSLGHAGKHALAAIPGLDVGFEQDSPYSTSADASGFCESLLTLSGEIALDEIVSVRRSPFSGHVYNLDTVGGWYIGNGIVTHNCRCSTQATTTIPLPLLIPFLP